MSSTSAPKIQTFKAGAAILKGIPVKAGADREHVVVCTAASDKSIGIAQCAATSAEDYVEVALNGGGGKALAQGTISMGEMLVPGSAGVVASSTGGERHCAVAMEDAVAGDMFATEVAIGIL